MERRPTDVPFHVKNARQPFIWLQQCTAGFPIHASPRYAGKDSEIPKAMLEVCATNEGVSPKERDSTNLAKDVLPAIIRCGV